MARKIQKLNSMPDYQARMPKYGHDISRSWTFGIAPGMIAPVYGHPVMSGSHLKGQHKVFARFNPILKPFLGAVDIHVDTFFVPISMLYTPSLSLFYQTDDLISSSIDRSNLVKDRFPLIDIDSSINDYIQAYCISGTDVNYDQAQGVHGSNPPVSAYPGVFECAPKSSIRFLDFMRLSYAQWFRIDYSVTTQFHNPNIFPWYPLAYQCVYQNWDKYRNSDREQKSYAYNLDFLYDRSSPYDSSELVDDLFTMRYADQYKDYFTSVKVSPIGSSVSMLGSASSWELLSRVNSYLFSSNISVSGRVDSQGRSTLIDDQATTTRTLINSTSFPQNFNISNIRQLFMVDKLLRVTGRSEKNYESQFLAHFGVKIPHDYQHNITHIAHSVGTLTPEPVISSSDTFTGTSGSSLGEVGGQGSVLFKGQEFSFDVPCHGFIITNIVFMPRYRYMMGIDRLYDLSSPDKWWQPELDKIGMQPLFEYETDIETYGSTPVTMSRRLGWQFGYEHLKRKPSGLSVHFYSPTSGSVQNLFAPWVLSALPFHHRDFQNNFIFADPVFYWSFKVPPTALNGVAEVMYNGLLGNKIPSSALSNLWDTRHTIFQSDPFIVDFTQDLSDLNFMSEYSEPELG